MKQRMMAVVAAVLVLVSLLSGGQVVLAEETTCTGELGAVTVDNLLVPQNATCTLNGTYVEGTIKVQDGASLFATGVTVIGNIQAEDALLVEVMGASSVNGNIQADGTDLVTVLEGTSVGGSIQLKSGGMARVDSVKVNGDILFDSNKAEVSATRSEFNLVGGNVQIFQNTGPINIVGNVIDGNLQCKENVPAPTGEDNIVHGNAEDQCADLAPPEDTTPPDTEILTAPSRATREEATFTFGGSDDTTPESLLLFECALDGGAFEPCHSPHTVQVLAGDEYEFQVRCLDMVLNSDPTPATYTWTATPRWRIYLPLIIRH